MKKTSTTYSPLKNLSFWVELCRELTPEFTELELGDSHMVESTTYLYQGLEIEFTFNDESVDIFDPISVKIVCHNDLESLDWIVTIDNTGYFDEQRYSAWTLSWKTHPTIVLLQNKANLKTKLKAL